MKNFIKSLIAYFALVFLSMSFFEKGIVLPENGLYFAATLFILTFTILIAEPFLKFLTVKVNFLTMFLMSSVLLIGVFFLLKLFMTDFYINEYSFEEMTIGTLRITSFIVKPTLTIIAASLTSAFLCSTFKGLDSV